MHEEDKLDQLFPTDRGTYILILRLQEPVHLTVGRLGAFDFPAGWYAYVGSAFGSGGLRGRLSHHRVLATKPHWHIDYLRTVAMLHEVWWLASEIRYEHQWASTLRTLPGALIPVPRFGASDCRCATHLVFFFGKPALADFSQAAEMTLCCRVVEVKSDKPVSGILLSK